MPASAETGLGTVAERGDAIALVGLIPDIEDLLEQILADEGHAARAYPLDIDPAALIHERPRVIVLQLDMAGRALALLDALRRDDATNAIPVIVLGSLEQMQEQAQAAGNVYTTLGMPFDLDDLLHALESALGHQPFEDRVRTTPPAGDPAFLQAAAILARDQRHIMLDWVQRIHAISPFSERPDLSLRDFLDSVPRLVNAYIAVLRHAVPATKTLEEDADVTGRIRSHAETRRAQAIPAEGVVHEYQLLHDVVIGRLQRNLDAVSVQPVVGEITRLFDEAQRITVARYDELGGST